jgi:glycosyltransferase involved in cell wall biosynthesis
MPAKKATAPTKKAIKKEVIIESIDTTSLTRNFGNHLPESRKDLRVAIAHDYFNQNGGAEKVVESLLKLYPDADVYTSTFIPENFRNDVNISKAYNEGRVKSTFLDKIFLKDGSKSSFIKYFKHLFFIYPMVMSFVEVKDYDVVIISSTYCGKNVKISNCDKVIHYCHSPVRFLHGLVTEKDHSSLSIIEKVGTFALKPILKYLDLKAVKYLNSKGCVWIANSNFIKATLSKVYGVSCSVIYPPVELVKYLPVVRNERPDEEFYLCHGRISFHKRLDLAILACLKLGKKLYISGISGLENDIDSLRALIPNDKRDQIVFLGRTTDDQLFEKVRNAKAMIFPGKEDAGIAPIEMLASGLPVIAYGAGGALEYVIPDTNGVFFKDQTVESLVEAIGRFEMASFDAKTIKASISEFSEEVFLTKMDIVVSNS